MYKEIIFGDSLGYVIAKHIGEFDYKINDKDKTISVDLPIVIDEFTKYYYFGEDSVKNKKYLETYIKGLYRNVTGFCKFINGDVSLFITMKNIENIEILELNKLKITFSDYNVSRVVLKGI